MLPSVCLHVYNDDDEYINMQFQTRLNVFFRHCLLGEGSVTVGLTSKARTLISFNI